MDAAGVDALAKTGEEGRRHGQGDVGEALGVGRRGGQAERAGLADGHAAGAVDAEVLEHRGHAVAHAHGAGGAGGQAAPAVAAQLGVDGEREEHARRGLLGLEQHAEAHRGALVDGALESEGVGVAADVGQAQAGAEAQGARLGRRGRPARGEGALDVGDAGAFVDHVDVDAAVVEARLEAAATGVDHDVHLGLVGGDHGAADRVGAGADGLEVGLDGARGGARLAVVAALDVVADVFHWSQGA